MLFNIAFRNVSHKSTRTTFHAPSNGPSNPLKQPSVVDIPRPNEHAYGSSPEEYEAVFGNPDLVTEIGRDCRHM